MTEQNAMVFDVYRGTTHDGPGMRSTVFFLGCPLRCGWCHNPEGIPTSPRVWWEARSCIGCGLCRAACPNGAVREDENSLYVDDAACLRCGACVAACPAKAMTFTAGQRRLESLVDEVLRDKAYYDATGGGVTASGGECMAQAGFVAAFFAALRARGVHTGLDTSGAVPYAAYEAVMPHTGLVLYDIKLMDGRAHKQHTGAGNTLILENLARLAGDMAEGRWDAGLWIRTPLVPGATASEENLAAIGAFIAEKLQGQVARWELCAFNNSCITKYQRLRQPWPYGDVPLLRAAGAEPLLQAARRVAGGVLAEEQIVLTGLVGE